MMPTCAGEEVLEFFTRLDTDCCTCACSSAVSDVLGDAKRLLEPTPRALRVEVVMTGNDGSAAAASLIKKCAKQLGKKSSKNQKGKEGKLKQGQV